MTEQELERLSALVDDELPLNEIGGEVNRLSQSEGARESWSRYHLIGDAMRNEIGTLYSTGLAQAISRRLQDEPVVLAPAAIRRSASHRSKTIVGLAVAASLAAVSVIMVPQLINPDGSESQPAVALEPAQPAPSEQTYFVAQDGTRWELLKKPAVESRLNAYLVKHQERSPASNIKGIMPYATFVSYDANKQ
ncbi:MAG: sigma-E factor negative regulatory protein [Chromatiales bacterium]|jgi:sigma-E factor negative regulatory protein RseA